MTSGTSSQHNIPNQNMLKHQQNLKPISNTTSSYIVCLAGEIGFVKGIILFHYAYG